MEHISEQRLALYAGGDLPPEEAANVEVHLRSCGDCEWIAGEYQRTQEMMAAAVQDPEPEELRELRAGITARLSDRPRQAVGWIWWAAAASAALVLLFALMSQRTRLGDGGGPVVAQTKVPETIWLTPALPIPHLETAVLRKQRTRQRPGIRTVALLTRPDEPSFLRMTTSDPNVVILWQPSERTQ